jgi:hypothetical protein
MFSLAATVAKERKQDRDDEAGFRIWVQSLAK